MRCFFLVKSTIHYFITKQNKNYIILHNCKNFRNSRQLCTAVTLFDKLMSQYSAMVNFIQQKSNKTSTATIEVMKSNIPGK